MFVSVFLSSSVRDFQWQLWMFLLSNNDCKEVLSLFNSANVLLSDLVAIHEKEKMAGIENLINEFEIKDEWLRLRVIFVLEAFLETNNDSILKSNNNCESLKTLLNLNCCECCSHYFYDKGIRLSDLLLVDMQSNSELFTKICQKIGIQQLFLVEIIKTIIGNYKINGQIECYYPKIETPKVKCPQCNKELLKGSLKGHLCLHTNVWPFYCSFCGKGKVSKYNLDLHERTHTGEKPFPCIRCDKKFTTNSLLLKHLEKKCMKNENKMD